MAAFLFLLYGCNSTQEEFYFLNLNLEPQQTEVRVYLDEKLSEPVITIDGFYQPERLVATEEWIFLVDFGDEFRTSRFNQKFVNHIGRGSGRGPGEIGQLSDIEITGDTLLFVDRPNARLHLYRPDGSFIDSKSIDERIPHRISALSSDQLLISTPETPEGGKLFVTGISGQTQNRFQPISDYETRYRFILESRFTEHNSFGMNLSG